ncbi:MAG TPA: hypothetical protein VKR06_35120 [Ktedonosporobacter sp.]|nr:hypothetical protein [Ktedonosporobacter sp.]
MMSIEFDRHAVDALITILQAKNLSYLIGDGSSGSQDENDPVHLIQRLAGCGYPLVENASISLFILHPELAPSIVEALQQSEPEIGQQASRTDR